MEIEDAVKAVASVTVAVVVLVLAAYFLVYVAIPAGVVLLAWRVYCYYQDHPDTIIRKQRKQAKKLCDTIRNLQQTFPTMEAFASSVWEGLVAPMGDKMPSFDIATHTFALAGNLYQAEGFADPPAAPPENSTALDVARHLDYVSKLATKLSSPTCVAEARDTIIRSLKAFCETLPNTAFQTFEVLATSAEEERLVAQFAVSIRSAAPSVGNSVQELALPFFGDTVIKSHLFDGLREQLNKNQHEMSDVPFTIENLQSPKLVMPATFDGTPDAIIRGFLRYTPLESLFDAKIPADIPERLRFEGLWIIAPPGRGKTTLLSRLLKADLEQVKAGKASVILMDSKGDLIDPARRLRQFAPGEELDGKLVLIEPAANLALNPLDIGASTGHTITLLEYVFSGLLDTAPTPLQSTLFRSVLLAMKAIPGATFDTFRSFLKDGWKPFEQHIHALHSDDAAFFVNGEYDSDTYKKTKQELLWRIRDLTTKVPLLRDMFKSPTTKLDIGEEMDAGKVIIIDNSTAKLSAGSEFFARYFIALILSAAEQRAGRRDDDKLPVYFYIDECDTAIARDTNIASILDRCRSQKIGLVLAHQRLQQIKLDDVKDALANCAVRIANSDDDASQLAPRMRTEADQLRSLKQGQFALFMRDLTPRPLIVDVPNERVDAWDKMTDAEFRNIQRNMHERYCHVPHKEPPPSYRSEPSPAPNDNIPSEW